MGKVKKIVMDESQAADVEKQADEKKKKYAEKLAKRKESQKEEVTVSEPKTRKVATVWEDLYSDLHPRIAEALRGARIKPDKLRTMADGEITAIEGIGETGLEEIRAKYSPAVAGSEETAKEGAAGVVEEVTKTGPRPANKRHLFRRGKAIRAAKSKVDRTKFYSISEAVKLVKATNITQFDATITVHLNLVTKDAPTRVELTFPHLAGAAKRIAIADDALLADIEKGKIEFDILLTTPAFMPKLAKFARILGPKGLMPSPKSGTISPDPSAKAKEFAGGKTVVKAEPKFPLMHVTVGKVGQPETELVANIQALIEGVKPKNITKAVIASTMSPGVKVLLS